MEKDDISLIKHALEDAPFGVVILNYQSKLIWLNDVIENYAGVSSNELVGRSRMTLPPEFEWLFKPEKRFLLPATAKRRPRWLKAINRTLHLPQATACVHYYMDVSAEQQMRQERDKLSGELEEVSLRDSLTGLPNRRALLHLLEPLVTRSRRYHNALSVLRINVSNIAVLGQKLGPETADKIMITISQNLRDQTRWADHIGRIGYGELLIVLPETDATATRSLTKKLLGHINDIETQAAIDQHRSKAELHVGAATWENGDDAKRLIRKAEHELLAHTAEDLSNVDSA